MITTVGITVLPMLPLFPSAVYVRGVYEAIKKCTAVAVRCAYGAVLPGARSLRAPGQFHGMGLGRQFLKRLVGYGHSS